MEKLSFDSDWQYTTEVGSFVRPPSGWQPVTLPHDAAAGRARAHDNPTGPAGGYSWSGDVAYRKSLDVSDSWAGRQVLLEFEGVYMNATVSVNGSVVALHPYGYTSFLVDITRFLRIGAQNEIAVSVNNSAQPNSRWYTGTGIYRHVWLRLGGAVRIKPWGVFVTTPTAEPAASAVVVRTEITNAGAATAEATLRTTVLDAAGDVVVSVESPLRVVAESEEVVRQELAVTDAKLWSAEEPHLYTLVSEVVVAGEVVDAETTTFGIRSISVDAKNGFRLNGRPLKMRGGCLHHDHGLLGAASYDRAEERKVELLKASGFNAIRSAHNPPAPALLDACDRLGMLVIDETFDCWRMGKNPHDYHLYFEDWWQRDTESMVKRDCNHPSVVMWSIGNEVPERKGVSDGYAWCARQADFVRGLDGTRPVTAAVHTLFEEEIAAHSPGSGLSEDMIGGQNCAPGGPEDDRWGDVTAPFFESLDVAGYNYINNRYEYDGDRFPERIICGSETFPLQAFESWTDTERLPNVIGDFVWTAIDYRGESGIGKVSFGDSALPFFAQDQWPHHLASCGDLDICGFKRAQSYFRDILWGIRSEPYIGVLHPGRCGEKVSFSPWGWEPVSDTWTFPGWEGKPTRVEVYSADDEVELVLNGVSLGRQPAGAAQKNRAAFEVTYEPGTLVAVGLKGGKEASRTTLVTAGAPAALRLTPDRTEVWAGASDLCYIAVEVVDEAGVRVTSVDADVSVEVTGKGELIALGTADPCAEVTRLGEPCPVYEGRVLAIVRSGEGEGEGEIRIRTASPGLVSAEAHITVGRSPHRDTIERHSRHGSA